MVINLVECCESGPVAINKSVRVKSLAYQSERAQDGQAGNALQAELEQRQEHDDEIENVPAFLEVELWTDGDQLEGGLDGERGRKELQTIARAK